MVICALLLTCAESSIAHKIKVPQLFSDEATIMDINGYIDGSYNYLVQDYIFTSGTHNRVYDLNPNGLTLHQAAATLAYQPAQGFGMLVNAIAGRDPTTFEPYGWPSIFGMQSIQFDVPQAFLQYAYDKLTIIGGAYTSLGGVEGIDPTLSNNYSRAILNGFAEPFTVLGARATYAVNKALNLIVGVNNGWDNITDYSRPKTLELSGNYSLNDKLSLATTYYLGGQRATEYTSTGLIGTRDLFDLALTFHATEKLTLMANYDYGYQTVATTATPNLNSLTSSALWKGVAGYANYKFNDLFQVSVRGEYFEDVNGYRTGVPQDWSEATLSLGYAHSKQLNFIAETRRDFSSGNVFLDKNGIDASNYQQSYALNVYYIF